MFPRRGRDLSVTNLMLRQRLGCWVAVLSLTLLNTSCGGKKEEEVASSSSCSSLAGSSWTPSVENVSSSNHNATTTVSQEVLPTATGSMIGLAQPAPTSVEITVSVPMMEDLGVQGSFSLIAKTKDVPSGMSVYPVLVYLSDGVNDFINLARQGTSGSGDCADAGYFTNSGSNNSGCTIQWPSAYFDRYHWQQHWMQAVSGSSAVDTFPTCNWSVGLNPSQANAYEQPACPFNSGAGGFLTAEGKLRTGVNYTAKYILIADGYSSLTGKTASLEVTLVKKKATSSGGAVDVNVIFVGSKIISDSRDSKGQKNLNILFGNIHSVFNQKGIKLGTIRAFEWGCDQGGDAYSDVETKNIFTMFSAGSSVIPASAAGINLFLINSFTDSTSVLGISSSIGGPYIQGTPLSGVAIATLGQLDKLNQNCTDASCPIESQDTEFRQMGPTIAHEMGHYFGLNHPTDYSKSSGYTHDTVYDTPICTQGSVTISSCANDTHAYIYSGKTCSQACPGYNPSHGVGFCPTQLECQFNHLMFRTSKYSIAGTSDGDGNLMSDQVAAILASHPLIQ